MGAKYVYFLHCLLGGVIGAAVADHQSLTKQLDYAYAKSNPEAVYTIDDLAKVADAWKQSYSELTKKYMELRERSPYTIDDIARVADKYMELQERAALDGCTPEPEEEYEDLVKEYTAEEVKEVQKNSRPPKIISDYQYNHVRSLKDAEDDWTFTKLKWWRKGQKLTDSDDDIIPLTDVWLTEDIIDELNNCLYGHVYIHSIKYDRYADVLIERKNSFQEECLENPEWIARQEELGIPYAEME